MPTQFTRGGRLFMRLTGAGFILLVMVAAAQAGPDELFNSVDRANAFIRSHTIAGIDSTCCVIPGDANHDGDFTIADAVYLVVFIFRNGPAPPCLNEADVNHDCRINIGDVVAMILPIFYFFAPPTCAPDTCAYGGY